MVKNYYYNKTIREVFNPRPKVGGEVGIEIECEGNHLPTVHDLPDYWTTHADGSLRGESCEYVLATPVSRKEILPALDVLEKAFKENKTKLKDSYRTSVHIHVNMQTVSVKQTYNTIILYGILEDILTEYAGPTRTGNLFCLRMSDAEYMLHALKEAATNDYYGELNSNFLRYAGCNVKSLFDHNSLEFRAFRGTSDMELIAQWSDILLQIKDAALLYENPAAILADFSALGPDAFLDKTFTKSIRALIKEYQGYQDRIYAGVRLVQDVAFASDWAPTPEKSEKDAKSKKAAKFYNIDPLGGQGLDGVGEDLDRLRMELGMRPVEAGPPPVLRQPRGARINRMVAPAVEAAADINWPSAQEEEI